MKKPDSLLQGQWPTQERMRQEGGIRPEGVGLTSKDEIIQLRARAKYPTKLHRYCEQYSLIDEPQRDAGLKYAELFNRTGWMPLYPVVWAQPAIKGTGGNDWTDRRIMAMKEFKAAEALLDKSEKVILRSVCGYDEFVSGKGWRERQSNTQILCSGLTKLVSFFGTDPEDRG